jgi:hypothetical protein
VVSPGGDAVAWRRRVSVGRLRVFLPRMAATGVALRWPCVAIEVSIPRFSAPTVNRPGSAGALPSFPAPRRREMAAAWFPECSEREPAQAPDWLDR